MIDRLLSRWSSRGDVLSTPGYSPTKAVTSRRVLNPDAQDLTIVIPPWHGGGRAYESYIRRLGRQGGAVVTYDFNDEILKPNVEQTLASFMQIQAVVAGELNELVKDHDYKNITVFAASLGNVALALIAEQFKAFDKAIMVVAGSDLAKSTWEGIRTQAIRRSFETQPQPYDEQRLIELWEPLAPAKHAAAFGGKDVDFIISTTDEVIPTVYQQEYADALKQADANVNVTYTRLGHYLAVGQACLFGE